MTGRSGQVRSLLDFFLICCLLPLLSLTGLLPSFDDRSDIELQMLQERNSQNFIQNITSAPLRERHVCR